MPFDAFNRPVTFEDLLYTYSEGCPVSIDDLILIRFMHIDFSGNDKVGQIVLNRTISTAFIEVMKIAYEGRYPIHQAVIMDHPAIKGNDKYSMEANNTSGFNYRRIAGTDRISNHSYGLAIDINPLMNPYLASDGTWYPSKGVKYIDRNEIQAGMLHETHDIVLAFMERGFEWGGSWERPDYHHFEFSDNFL
jgi:hypothetical protein